MKKKIITTLSVVLGLVALFSSVSASATEAFAFQLGVYPVCTSCHVNGNLNNSDKSNLMPAANAAYQKDRFGLSGLKAFVAASTAPVIPTCTNGEVLNTAQTACVNPPPPTCTNGQVLNATQTACITPAPVIPTCTNGQVLNATQTACITPAPVIPTCTNGQVLNAAQTACITPAPVVPTCTNGQVLNTAQTACVNPSPPTCINGQVLNAAQTACVNPPPPTCTNGQVLNATQTACITPAPVIPTCTNGQVLTNNICVTKPTTPLKNTKPVLNSVAPQWDVQVGEVLTIPLSVNDAEQDDFTILTSKLVGSTLSETHPDAAGLPSIDFEWIPTLANVNKIQSMTFQAKELNTKQKYPSNKVAVKIRVWAAGDRDAASITKLNVMTSKLTAGTLKLAGNVKFNNLLTPAERQAFIDQTLDLTISDLSRSIYSEPLTVDKKGNWAISIPLTLASCDITLEFAGQNATRKVVGCNANLIKTVASNNNFNGEKEGAEVEHKNGSGKED